MNRPWGYDQDLTGVFVARSEARISVAIWSDDDFRELSADGQWMYMFLLSQPDMAHTGVVPLRPRRWARAAAGLDEGEVGCRLKELVVGRFVVVDEDTGELLIRSFIRHDKVYRQPNVLRAAADHLGAVASGLIRTALAEELARVLHADDITMRAAQTIRDMLAVLRPNAGIEGYTNPDHDAKASTAPDRCPV